VRFTLGLLILAPVFAQTPPDAAALLARQASELQRYHSYRLTEDTSMDVKMPGMSMPPMTYTTVTQAANPGKMHAEMKTAGIDAMLMISDGENTWMYMPWPSSIPKCPPTPRKTCKA